VGKGQQCCCRSEFAHPVKRDDDDICRRAAPLLLLARRCEDAQLLGSDRQACCAAPRPWALPPECEEHQARPHKVIRYGRYATSTPQPRQRYRCTREALNPDETPTLDDKGKPGLIRHVFTPALPRDHVHPDEIG
jgi:hypothetical protein